MKECVISDESANVVAVRSAIQSGERDLVAAGGDGTVNALLNAVMSVIDDEMKKEIRFGAIGLGSSNDFHKPFDATKCINGFPVAINGELAQLRDVGRLSYTDHAGELNRYFLINASIGVTADANHLFSHPDHFLGRLKHVSTPISIYYAALKTIATACNRRITLKAGNDHTYNISLTNLAILKSPYVSGNLKYPCVFDPSSGLFDVVMHHSMSRTQLLALLASMTLNRPRGSGPETISFRSPGLSISSEEPFAVEFDGETLVSSEVECTVIRQALMVCR